MSREVDKSQSTTPAAGKRSGEVDAFLSKLKSAPKPASSAAGRLIFALDATASRQASWDKAMHLQAGMFQEAAKVGNLAVQLVFYRGFGECKASKWYTDSSALLRAMTGVGCLGGQTQLGKVLKHTRDEALQQKVGALVFVGDAFEEDIDKVCHRAGELGLAGVPAFMFQEGNNPMAANAFRQIAKLTGGAYCPFNDASASQLAELLRAVAVFAAGGQRALANFSAGKGNDVRQLAATMKALPGR
ncbi:MAG: VWA domain-containing protein [Alphaproteobacteria bacterium]